MVIPRSKSHSFTLCFNMCFLLLSFQQVRGQIAVWPGRCDLGTDLGSDLRLGRSQPDKEPRHRFAKASDGFAKEWLRTEVAFSLCLADTTWPQVEVRSAGT